MARKKSEENSETSLSPKQIAFISEFIKARGNKTKAAKAAGISRQTVYNWEDNRHFLTALKAAEQQFADALYEAAFNFAIGGDKTLLIFLLKSLVPEKFDEQIRKLDHIGKTGITENGPVVFSIENATLPNQGDALDAKGDPGHIQ